MKRKKIIKIRNSLHIYGSWRSCKLSRVIDMENWFLNKKAESQTRMVAPSWPLCFPGPQFLLLLSVSKAPSLLLFPPKSNRSLKAQVKYSFSEQEILNLWHSTSSSLPHTHTSHVHILHIHTAHTYHTLHVPTTLTHTPCTYTHTTHHIPLITHTYLQWFHKPWNDMHNGRVFFLEKGL